MLGDGVDRLKPKGVGETVRDIVVECVAPPPLAPMVMVDVPVVALAIAEKDTVTEQVGVHGLFVKVEVTPLGNAEVENITDDAVPLTRVAVIDDVELVLPWATVRLPGEGMERLNSNGAATVNDMLVE